MVKKQEVKLKTEERRMKARPPRKRSTNKVNVVHESVTDIDIVTVGGKAKARSTRKQSTHKSVHEPIIIIDVDTDVSELFNKINMLICE